MTYLSYSLVAGVVMLSVQSWLTSRGRIDVCDGCVEHVLSYVRISQNTMRDVQYTTYRGRNQKLASHDSCYSCSERLLNRSYSRLAWLSCITAFKLFQMKSVSTLGRRILYKSQQITDFPYFNSISFTQRS